MKIMLKKSDVVKANELVNTRFSLGLEEQRILLACVAQIDSKAELNTGTVFEVQVQEIADLVGETNSSHIYKKLEKAALRLRKSSFYTKTETGYKERGWCDEVEYFTGQGRIQLTFHKNVLQYLTKLERQFTKYKLKDVAKFTNCYSLRVYELLAQWQGRGTREIKVRELREMLCLENKYLLMAEFKRNVIKKAVDDINKHSNLTVRVGTRKVGREIVSFQFEFVTDVVSSDNNQKITNKTTKEKSYFGLTTSEIEKQARVGESYFEAGKRLSKAKSKNVVLELEQELERKKAKNTNS